MKIKLRPIQQQILEIIKVKRQYGIFLDMGLGKTALVLSLIDYIVFDRFERCNTLIIAPASVANLLEVWQDEIKKWEDFEFFDYILLDGTQKQRIKKIEENEKPMITLMSDALITWWKKEYKNLNDYDMIIIDESSRFKSHTAKKFKELEGMIDLNKHRVYELSGTPRPQSFLDLWPQIFLLDKGKRLGSNFYDFRNKWFINYGYKFFLTKGNKAYLTKKLKDIVMFAESDVDLPPRKDITVLLEFSEEKAKIFKKFKSTYIIELEEKDVTVLDKRNLLNKCLQLSNGAIYKNAFGEYEIFDDTKIEWVKKFSKENPTENALVFYSYKFDKKRLLEIEGAEEIKDPDSKNRWNEGKIKLGIISPSSFQYGGNLQFGGRTIIWFGLKFGLENFLQSNKRVWRPGQTQEVFIYYLLMKNTYDTYALEVLNGKDDDEKDFLNSIKLTDF